MRSLDELRRFGGSPFFSRSSDGSVYGPSTTRSAYRRGRLGLLAPRRAGGLRDGRRLVVERVVVERRAGRATPVPRRRCRPTDRRSSRRRSPRHPRLRTPEARRRRRTVRRSRSIRVPNIARTVSGTSRIVVPVTSSRPNSTPMNSSGAAIHWVSPSDSGPPMAKPMKPAACWRPGGVSGEPDHRCHRPSAGSVIIAAPRISRGRASGSGSVRIRTTAIAMSASGNSRTADPISTRRKSSIHPPTGRAASNHELATTTTAMPSSASAIPSRRWPGSMSRARPDRTGRRSGAPGQHQPAGAGAPADGQPGRRRCASALRRLAGFRRGGGPARRGSPTANRPLTCSNGHRSARRSY